MKPTNNEKTEKLVSKEEKYDNTKFWISYGIDLEKRRIMLDEGVDEYSIGWIIRALRKMIDEDKTSSVELDEGPGRLVWRERGVGGGVSVPDLSTDS